MMEKRCRKMKADEQIIELLTQILKVEAIQAASNKSITEGARLLKTAGLDNQTIAEVLNTSAATVRSLTANLRTRHRGGRRTRRT
jgi:3-hydroxyisobutyrate dehydrogenase-like beta-hydroxyacid dehydrogenase